jgi:acetyltransferase-like isoleucine patch superfamily enzyme
MSIRNTFIVARNRYWLHACDQLGARPHLDGRPTINTSSGRIRIGDRFRLSSRPVPSHLVAGPSGVLEIGHDVSIAHGAAVAAFEDVRIGDGTRIGPFVVIMDTNFHDVGNQSIKHDCRPVSIGKNCRIGSRVTITRGAAIGNGAEILAGSVVSSTIPPGVCAGGGRARVIGRAGESTSRWDGIAALLPELVTDIFGLAATPNLDTRGSQIPGWNTDQQKELLAAIEERFGVSIEVSAANSLADMIAEVERAHASSRSQIQGLYKISLRSESGI